jgi:DNA (cytosine-5)-methyltransferase 1
VGESEGRHPHAPPAASASPRTQVQQRLDEGNVNFTPRSAAVPLEQEAAAFTFSELFGGIGMFRTALERVGGRATFAVEVAPPAQLVYALNHRCWHDCPAALQLPNAKSAVSCASTMEIRDAALPPLLVRDITEIPSAFFPRHDVLTGGFPCQSFAKAGAAAGLNAEKGWLFYEVVRVLAATRPAAFLLENVEHLVEVEAGAQLEEILYRLRHPTSAPAVHSFTEGKYGSADGGVEYEVRHVVIDGGVLTPQTRRRVYFFGFRKGQGEGGGNSNSSSSSAAAPHFKYPHAEESVAAGVVADALERLQQAAKTAPYRCVRDLLVVPSVKDHPVCTRDGSLRVCQQRPDDTDRCGSSLQLTPVQWEAVQRSHTFRQNPMWRVCDVNGKARTLLGSYRTSYQLYSEFIPYAPEQTLHEVLDILAMADPRAEGGSACGKTQPRCTNTTTTIAPPLRFLSIRECARLQGIDDCFCFPHEEDSTLVLSSLAKDEEEEGEVTRRLRIPPAVLRQVPSGAVYKLIGNAVNPLVVECLGSAIAAYLQRRRAG